MVRPRDHARHRHSRRSSLQGRPLPSAIATAIGFGKFSGARRQAVRDCNPAIQLRVGPIRFPGGTDSAPPQALAPCANLTFLQKYFLPSDRGDGMPRGPLRRRALRTFLAAEKAAVDPGSRLETGRWKGLVNLHFLSLRRPLGDVSSSSRTHAYSQDKLLTGCFA